jgi:hypothetical protein
VGGVGVTVEAEVDDLVSAPLLTLVFINAVAVEVGEAERIREGIGVTAGPILTRARGAGISLDVGFSVDACFETVALH